LEEAIVPRKQPSANLESRLTGRGFTILDRGKKIPFPGEGIERRRGSVNQMMQDLCVQPGTGNAKFKGSSPSLMPRP